jgi:ferric-dicitrate binding protein FerR (iron transport regulator)
MTTMKTRMDMESRSIAEQAAEWLLILEEGNLEDQEAFADWLTRSPLHVGAFLRASAVDELGRGVDWQKLIKTDLGPFEEPHPFPLSSSAEKGEGKTLKGAGQRGFGGFGWRKKLAPARRCIWDLAHRWMCTTFQPNGSCGF